MTARLRLWWTGLSRRERVAPARAVTLVVAAAL
jgi:hypothetical protein